jgi:hypothetical protein
MGEVMLAFGLGVFVGAIGFILVCALIGHLIGHLVSEGVADELKKVKK